MTEKIEDMRWMISNRADKLWDEGMEISSALRFDDVKVALEHLIEGHFMVSNMWKPEFVRGVSLASIDWLLKATEAEEVVYEINKPRVVA